MSTPGGWAAPGQGAAAGGEPTTAPEPPTTPAPGPPPSPPHTPPAPAQPPTGWQQPRPVTYQPGVIPFRPLGMGDIYSAAFKIIRGNPASTVGAALVIALLALIPTTPLGLWVASQGSSDLFDPEAALDDSSAADAILVTGGQLIPAIAGSLATVALAGFIAYVTGQAVLGRKVKLPETWRGTRPHLLRVIGVSVLVSVVVFAVSSAFLAPGVAIMVVGGTSGDDSLLAIGLVVLLGLGLLLIPTLLLLWTRLAFVGPVVVLEGVGIGVSLRRSWQLSRFPGFWRVLGIRLLTTLLVSLVAQVLATPVTLVVLGVTLGVGADPQTLLAAQVLATAVTTLISAAATTPVTATVDTLLYLDQRIRTEGLDVQLIQAVEGRAPLPWHPALDPHRAAP